MDNLLISKDDTITIKFSLGKLKEGRIVVAESTEFLKEIYEENLDDTSIENHEAIFRMPSFGDTVNMASNIRTNDGVSVDFNPFAVRFERMRNLLKSWTLKSGEEDIAANAENLSSLPPNIANFIATQLEIELQ